MQGKAWIAQSVGSLIEGTGVSSIIWASPFLYWQSKQCPGVENDTTRRALSSPIAKLENPSLGFWLGFSLTFLCCVHLTTHKFVVLT